MLLDGAILDVLVDIWYHLTGNSETEVSILRDGNFLFGLIYAYIGPSQRKSSPWRHLLLGAGTFPRPLRRPTTPHHSVRGEVTR